MSVVVSGIPSAEGITIVGGHIQGLLALNSSEKTPPKYPISVSATVLNPSDCTADKHTIDIAIRNNTGSDIDVPVSLDGRSIVPPSQAQEIGYTTLSVGLHPVGNPSQDFVQLPTLFSNGKPGTQVVLPPDKSLHLEFLSQNIRMQNICGKEIFATAAIAHNVAKRQQDGYFLDVPSELRSGFPEN